VTVLYESFDDAWSDFLARDDFLEDFFAQSLAAHVDTWWIVPPPEVKLAALRLQSELERFDFLTLLPHDYLHVTVPGPVGAAGLTYARVNCFPTAVVVEVGGLEGPSSFLPHLTLAVTTRAAPPDELRAVLGPLRETFLGRQRVEESIRVSFPLSRERLFEPWTVHERVPVGR
jgi:hypothetical protein